MRQQAFVFAKVLFQVNKRRNGAEAGAQVRSGVSLRGRATRVWAFASVTTTIQCLPRLLFAVYLGTAEREGVIL